MWLTRLEAALGRVAIAAAFSCVESADGTRCWAGMEELCWSYEGVLAD